MVAGLQLTSIGSLSLNSWRLAIAITGLVVALVAIGYMIWRTSLLLANEWITLAQLSLERFKVQLRNSSRRRDKIRGEQLDRIYEELEVYQDELYGAVASSVADLYAQLKKANEAARKRPWAVQAWRSAALRDASNAVVQYANYSYTRKSFEALRIQLTKAAIIVAAGVLVFAYAANPPKSAGASSPASPSHPTHSPSTGVTPSIRPTASSSGAR